MDSLELPGSREWGTPDTEIAPLHALYDFTLDGAASHDNAVVPRYCTLDGTFERAQASGKYVFEPGTCTCDGKRGRCPCEPPEIMMTCAHALLCPVHARETTPEIWTVKLSALDGIGFPWVGERTFCNPPWGASRPICLPGCSKQTCAKAGHTDRYLPGIADFLIKARDNAVRHRALTVMLFPARTDSAWYHEIIEPFAHPLPGWPSFWRRGRVKFNDPEAETRRAAGMPPRTGPPVGIGYAVFE